MQITINNQTYTTPDEAHAAIEALVAEEAAGWVEWIEPTVYGATRYRCRPDGSQPEIDDNGWRRFPCRIAITAFFRKGREIALAERDEQAQALADAVLRLESDILNWGDLRELFALARAVKL